MIAHLTKQCGGNVADLRVVSLDSSVFNEHQYHRRHAVELDSDSEFASASVNDPSITYDFKGRIVGLSGYVIRSRTHAMHNRSGNMKLWRVSVSMDGRLWTLVDERLDEERLNGRKRTVHFPVQSRASGRLVRVQHIGRSHSGWLFMAFSALEFFDEFV
jgi:hypothetical protein